MKRVIDILTDILESDASLFVEDENTDGVYYIPLCRARSDSPFSAERVQECWNAARAYKDEKTEDIFNSVVLENAWDTSVYYPDLKADFARVIGETILNGETVEGADGFDFDEWFSEHVRFRAFTSDWRRDIYTVCFDIGETLESFLAKHPDVDFRDALERVYADPERDGAESVYYVGNMENAEIWGLSDTLNGDGKKIHVLNVRLGGDDLDICLDCEFETGAIKEVTIEEPDMTARDAIMK